MANKLIKKLFKPVVKPFNQFIQLEASSGIILLSCGIIAMVLANSAFGEDFLGIWEKHLSISINKLELNKSLIHWINDGLMVVFFLIVGLEIKREMIEGQLSSVRKAMLPIFGALGGMLFPAMIYFLFNRGLASVNGWGIPMATDIAFALAILTLVGNRVPIGLKIFLAALAIADDLGAVLVIAVFYTQDLQLHYLYLAGGTFFVLLMMNLFDIRTLPLYLLIGVVLWYFVLKSGIHATIAGVLLAITIPFRMLYSKDQLMEMTKERLSILRADIKSGDLIPRDISEELENISHEVSSPAQRLEHYLHKLVAYAIMPIFALANTGVVIESQVVSQLVTPVSLGVIFGLLLGKPLGISLFAWIAVRLRLADLPAGVTWRHIIGAGFLGGIGFTMSIFITLLAFSGDAIHSSVAKLSIVIASVSSGLVGYFFLKSIEKPTNDAEA